jgi:FlaA1/EpsC-like NDP-sugar epimerase
VIGRGGEVFVLNMGEPVKIAQLARQLIRMSGKAPDKDIKIEYSGLRPGEKLADELFHNDETPSKSTHDKILQAQGRPVDSAIVLEAIEAMRQACEQFNDETMNSILQRLVPEYCAETDHRILNEPRRTE